MKTALTKKTVQDHFHYHWWMYVLAALLAFGLVDLTLSVSRPRVPNEKKVELYVYGMINSEGLNAYLEEIRAEYLPEQQEITAYEILPDDNYGYVQLTTYLASAEGDVYLLGREEFLNLSASGAFLPLEDQADLLDLFTEAGLDLRRGWRTLRDSDETHLYGIPVSFLPGLSQYAYYPEDGLLCVITANGNDENVLAFFKVFCEKMLVPPPEPEPTEIPAE